MPIEDETPVSNFDLIKDLLLSTDMDRYTELENLKLSFLDGNVNLAVGAHQVAIQSFVGAGNDLLGRLIEKITRIYCGADSNCHFNFDRAMGSESLGEMHTS